jgi:hypothetical protein
MSFYVFFILQFPIFPHLSSNLQSDDRINVMELFHKCTNPLMENGIPPSHG